MIEILKERVGWSPFSVATRAGDCVFVGGVMPIDWNSGLLPSARPGPGRLEDPLGLQSKVTLDVFRRILRDSGCDLGNVGRLTQWFRGSRDWPSDSAWSGISISSYMEARAKLFSPSSPSSTAVAVRDLIVPDALLCMDAVVNTKSESRMLPVPDEPGRPSFPAGTLAGDRVYLSGRLPTNWRDEDGSAVHPEARLDETLWYGSRSREQARHVLEGLARDAESASIDLDHAVHANVFLADANDLAGFEESWKRFFPHRPPARTVITGSGLAARGCRVEVDLELFRQRGGIESVEVSGLPSFIGHAPEAVTSGDLLHFSGQMSVSEDGAHPSGVAHPEFRNLCSPEASQLRIVLERMERICREAGTTLEETAMLRVFMSDLSDFGAALHVLDEAFGAKCPTGTIVGVGELPIEGCRVMVDGIVHLTRRRT